jgi:hypothetical protein
MLVRENPCEDKGMKTGTADMIEGTEAFTRFKMALKAVLTVPKSAMPPSPFKPHTAKKSWLGSLANPSLPALLSGCFLLS